MAQLSYKSKKGLPDSAFAIVKTQRTKTVKMRKVRKYPIPDIAHARNALARVSQFGTSSEKAAVRQKVKSKFPSINVGRKKPKKKGR